MGQREVKSTDDDGANETSSTDSTWEEDTPTSGSEDKTGETDCKDQVGPFNLFGNGRSMLDNGTDGKAMLGSRDVNAHVRETGNEDSNLFREHFKALGNRHT